MLGIVLNLPPFVDTYLASYTVPEVASHVLLFFGWIPIFGVIIWGFTQVWIDFKQGQYFHHLHWTLLNVSVPAGAINTPKGMENFFNNLAGTKSAITWKESHLQGKFQTYFAFEIVGCEGDVQFYIRTQEKYVDMVEAALYAQYPEAHIHIVDDYVHKIPDKYPNDTHKLFGSEFVLAKPQFYPIRTYESFEHQGEKDFRFKDPMLNTIELMGKMGKGEYLWLQFLIMQPDEQDWAKEGEKYLDKMMGKEEKHAPPGILMQAGSALASLPGAALRQATGIGIGGDAHDEHKSDDFRMFKMTPKERELSDAIAEKIGKIGWYSKIRIIYIGPKDHFRKPMMASAIKGVFHPFAHLGMNKLGMHNAATPKDDYFWMEWQYTYKMTRLAARYKARSFAGATPYILNSEELATLFHFPAFDARTPILTNIGARRGEAPTTLPFAPTDAPNMMIHGGDGHADNAPGHHKEEAIDTHALSVPTPHMTPQPGMPAPLPPGLDLAPTAIDDTDDAPPNLPVL